MRRVYKSSEIAQREVAGRGIRIRLRGDSTDDVCNGQPGRRPLLRFGAGHRIDYDLCGARARVQVPISKLVK